MNHFQFTNKSYFRFSVSWRVYMVSYQEQILWSFTYSILHRSLRTLLKFIKNSQKFYIKPPVQMDPTHVPLSTVYVITLLNIFSDSCETATWKRTTFETLYGENTKRKGFIYNIRQKFYRVECTRELTKLQRWPEVLWVTWIQNRDSNNCMDVRAFQRYRNTGGELKYNIYGKI